MSPDVNLFIYIYIIYKVESKYLLYSENRHMNDIYHVSKGIKKHIYINFFTFTCIYYLHLLFKTFTYYLKSVFIYLLCNTYCNE